LIKEKVWVFQVFFMNLILELVPFRLTRDIIDGFGIAGLAGVFKICAEQTMNVLRKNSTLIHVILEVFLYDPLVIIKF
jgi:ataxia telangiectasia mutated family protein